MERTWTLELSISSLEFWFSHVLVFDLSLPCQVSIPPANKWMWHLTSGLELVRWCVKHTMVSRYRKSYINVSSLLLNPGLGLVDFTLFLHLSLWRSFLITIFYCAVKVVKVCEHPSLHPNKGLTTHLCWKRLYRIGTKSRGWIVGYRPVWASPWCCQSTRPYTLTQWTKLSWGPRPFCITGLFGILGKGHTHYP